MGRGRSTLPIEPEGPWRMEREWSPVLDVVCDVFQFFLVDVNVVFRRAHWAASSSRVQLQVLGCGCRHFHCYSVNQRFKVFSLPPHKKRACFSATSEKSDALGAAESFAARPGCCSAASPPKQAGATAALGVKRAADFSPLTCNTTCFKIAARATLQPLGWKARRLTRSDVC